MLPKWQQCARSAKFELESAKYGERDAILRSVAAKYGLKDSNSVRRALHAHLFLEQLEKEHFESFVKLTGAPLAVAERISRWYRSDPAAALKGVEEWSQGKHSVRSIAGAMSAEKPQTLLTGAEQAVTKAIVARIGGDLTKASIGGKDSQDGVRLDYRFLRLSSSKERPEAVAALMVGPYQDASLYRKRRQNWVLRAFGLSWIYDYVVLILPDREEVRSYDSWIKSYKRRIDQAQRIQEEKRRRIPSRTPAVCAVLVDSQSSSHLTTSDEAALEELARMSSGSQE